VSGEAVCSRNQRGTKLSAGESAPSCIESSGKGAVTASYELCWQCEQVKPSRCCHWRQQPLSQGIDAGLRHLRVIGILDIPRQLESSFSRIG
jgi:hypothetical protein